jgi:DNA-binding NarL/FixJ family response regulator
VTRKLIAAYIAEPEPARGSLRGVLELDQLTPREHEVLALVARGLSNHEIAHELHLSPLTAKTHVSRILMKLNARDRIQLVILAYEYGLIRTHQ